MTMYNDVVTACEIAIRSDKSRTYCFVDNWHDRDVLFCGTFYNVMHKIIEYNNDLDGDHSIMPVDDNDVESWALLDYIYILQDIERGDIKYSGKFLDIAMSNVASSM